MTLQEYTYLSQRLLEEAHEIETAKRPAYTIGSADVLANFKRVAERTGCHAGQVLAVYMLKHVDAVTAALCDPSIPQAEAILGRFADNVNYLKLGFALVTEVAGATTDRPSPLPAPAGRPPSSVPLSPETLRERSLRALELQG